MKCTPVTLSVCLALGAHTGLALAASPPEVQYSPDQTEAIDTRPDYHQPLPIPGAQDITAPEVDITGVLYHLDNQDTERAHDELRRLRSENPGWRPPVALQQLLDDTPYQSQPDHQYLSLMAELAATPESERAGLSAQRLELASREVYQRRDGYHAMLLGWIHFQREEYRNATQLFTEAGQWGEEQASRQGRSLVSLRLAEQAVARGDYSGAQRLAEEAAALGNEESHITTGWMLYNSQAYDEALATFTKAPPTTERERALAETCYQQAVLALSAGEDQQAEQAARCSQQHGRDDVLSALGWRLYEAGQYPRASHFFAAQQPASEESRYGDALARQASGDTSGARALACTHRALSQRLTQLCHDLYSSQMLTDYRAGRHEAVVQQAHQLEQFTKLGNDQQALLAWSELYAGHHDAAARRFEQLLLQQPNEASHAHGLIDSLTRHSDDKALAEAGQRHPLVAQILARRTSAAAPPSPTLDLSRYQDNGAAMAPIDGDQLARAIELYHAEQYEEALQRLTPLRPGILESRDHGLLTLSGWAAFHTGNPAQARDDFTLAAEWQDEASIWLMVVEAEIALQNLDRAQAITEGLAPSPERSQMLARLTALRASAAYHDGDYALAESLYNDPALGQQGEHLEMLGWSRYQQAKYPAAISAFEAAYRLEPTLSRARGLVFSHIHLREPAKLVALADALHGPLAELTDDPEVRAELAEGREDWVGVSSDGYLVVQEPVRTPNALTRALQKLEAIPGYTWGSVDHSLVDKDTHVSYLVNQGIDWFVLPGDITFNTFIEYRSIHNEWQSLYDDDEVVIGMELKRSPFRLGVEHAPATWRGNDEERDITTAYLGWYQSWYQYLRRRGSTTPNPFDVDAYDGATYGRISHQFDDTAGTTARGFVRAGMDWTTWITPAGDFTLNTYASYRFRFRSWDKHWYNAHGPAVGIEINRSPFSLGVDYMWQQNPERGDTTRKYGLYLTWYYDWNLMPE